MMALVFDGTSVLYAGTLLVLLLVLSVIFVHRQIQRLRHNAARIRPHLSLRSRVFRKKIRQSRDVQLDNVSRLCREYHARLTDCVALITHSEKQYIHRMIAIDEVTMEIDRQLERIDGAVHRNPGESTYSYLLRIRNQVPNIPITLVHRISYLQEAARFYPQKFDVEQLMELRSCLHQFVKILSDEYESLDVKDNTSSRGVVASFYLLGQRMMPLIPQYSVNSRKRRNKFGGSDGGRLLAREKEDHLDPGWPNSRLRRQSDSHSNLLP